MTTYKKLLLVLIVSAILLIAVLNTFLDFSRLSDQTASKYANVNELLKRLNVLLAFFLVLLAGKDRLDVRDHLIMKCVFTAIMLGEICFLLAKPVPAICSFAVCQSLLILRHSRGLAGSLHKSSNQQLGRLFISGLVLALAFIAAAQALSPYVPRGSLFVTGAVYGILLSISLWAGYANHVLNLYPPINSKQIAAGMFCFYCCDILVGLDSILQPGTAGLLAASFIWVFYTPAITLLALSCYNYKADKSGSSIKGLRLPYANKG